MKRITALMLSLLLACALIFTGCAAKSDAYMEYDSYATAAPEAAEDYNYSYGRKGDVMLEGGFTAESPATENFGTTGTSVATNRKLIKTVRMTVETEYYAELMQSIETKVGTLGGYIEAMDANTPTNAKNRNASLTIRIPADRLEDFTNEVEAEANVIWRNQEQKDITTTYVDTKAHRDALEVEQTRLLALLEQAENLSEILEIESRLTQVRYELESMESLLRSYDNLVDYATIHLEVREVEVLTPIVVEEPGFWEKIGDGFVKSAKGVWNAIKSIFSGIVIALPYLVVILLPPAIILIIIFSVKKRRNRY